MAKIYHNTREHLVIIINSNEATTLDFGIQITGLNNLCLCGTCNNEISPKEIYYICGINECMCKSCAEDYCKNMNHYIDDSSIQYEINHFNAVASALNMNERAACTPDSKIIIYNKNDINKMKNCYT